MKKECGNCPFKRSNTWKVREWKDMAQQEINRQKIFSCHMRNDINVFSVKPMVHDDCAGYKKMNENMVTPGKHPHIVDYFEQTNPTP